MLHVTRAAWERLRHLKERAGLTRPDMALRLVSGQPGELGVVAAVRQRDDHVLPSDGVPLLLVQPGMARMLAGRTLDYVPSGEAARLVLR